MKDYTLEKRKYVIGAAAIVIVIIYVFRLFDLQIMTDDYKKNADSFSEQDTISLARGYLRS